MLLLPCFLSLGLYFPRICAGGGGEGVGFLIPVKPKWICLPIFRVWKEVWQGLHQNILPAGFVYPNLNITIERCAGEMRERTTEADGHRESTQHGVLPCLQLEERGGGAMLVL